MKGYCPERGGSSNMSNECEQVFSFQPTPAILSIIVHLCITTAAAVRGCCSHLYLALLHHGMRKMMTIDQKNQ